MPVLLLLLLFVTPVRLAVTWDHGLAISLRIWGIGRTWPVSSPAAGSPSSTRLLRLAGTVLRTDKARRFLVQHVELIVFQAMLHLGLASAASTAVYTGLLQLVTQLLPPKTDIRIQPDFRRPTRVQFRCIVFFHLGTLLITAGMLLWAYLLEAREHPIPRSKEA